MEEEESVQIMLEVPRTLMMIGESPLNDPSNQRPKARALYLVASDGLHDLAALRRLELIVAGELEGGD